MFYIIIMIIAIILDQITKYLAVVNLRTNSGIPIIQDALHLTYTENTGAAFSMFSDKKWFLVVLTSLGMLLLFVYFLKFLKKDGCSMLKLSLALVIAGGLGNLIDRIRLSYVVDFIDFRLINFAIFNVADIFICVGAFLLILDTFFISKTLLKGEEKPAEK